MNLNIRFINNWKTVKSFGFNLFDFNICLWFLGGYITLIVFGFGFDLSGNVIKRP